MKNQFAKTLQFLLFPFFFLLGNSIDRAALKVLSNNSNGPRETQKLERKRAGEETGEEKEKSICLFFVFFFFLSLELNNHRTN